MTEPLRFTNIDDGRHSGWNQIGDENLTGDTGEKFAGGGTYSQEAPVPLNEQAKLPGEKYVDMAKADWSRRAEFEQKVIQDIGGNPNILTAKDALTDFEKSGGYQKLFEQVFSGQASWYDQERLDPQQRAYWEKAVMAQRANVVQQSGQELQKMKQQYDYMMGNFDAKAKMVSEARGKDDARVKSEERIKYLEDKDKARAMLKELGVTAGNVSGLGNGAAGGSGGSPSAGGTGHSQEDYLTAYAKKLKDLGASQGEDGTMTFSNMREVVDSEGKKKSEVISLTEADQLELLNLATKAGVSAPLQVQVKTPGEKHWWPMGDDPDTVKTVNVMVPSILPGNADTLFKWAAEVKSPEQVQALGVVLKQIKAKWSPDQTQAFVDHLKQIPGTKPGIGAVQQDIPSGREKAGIKASVGESKLTGEPSTRNKGVSTSGQGVDKVSQPTGGIASERSSPQQNIEPWQYKTDIYIKPDRPGQKEPSRITGMITAEDETSYTISDKGIEIKIPKKDVVDIKQPFIPKEVPPPTPVSARPEQSSPPSEPEANPQINYGKDEAPLPVGSKVENDGKIIYPEVVGPPAPGNSPIRSDTVGGGASQAVSGYSAEPRVVGSKEWNTWFLKRFGTTPEGAGVPEPGGATVIRYEKPGIDHEALDKYLAYVKAKEDSVDGTAWEQVKGTAGEMANTAGKYIDKAKGALRQGLQEPDKRIEQRIKAAEDYDTQFSDFQTVAERLKEKVANNNDDSPVIRRIIETLKAKQAAGISISDGELFTLARKAGAKGKYLNPKIINKMRKTLDISML